MPWSFCNAVMTIWSICWRGGVTIPYLAEYRLLHQWLCMTKQRKLSELTEVIALMESSCWRKFVAIFSSSDNPFLDRMTKRLRLMLSSMTFLIWLKRNIISRKKFMFENYENGLQTTVPQGEAMVLDILDYLTDEDCDYGVAEDVVSFRRDYLTQPLIAKLVEKNAARKGSKLE